MGGNTMHGAWMRYLAATREEQDRRRADEWRRLYARPDAEPLLENAPIGWRSKLNAPLSLIRRVIPRQA